MPECFVEKAGLRVCFERYSDRLSMSAALVVGNILGSKTQTTKATLLLLGFGIDIAQAARHPTQTRYLRIVHTSVNLTHFGVIGFCLITY
jgi:hypothetical protein